MTAFSLAALAGLLMASSANAGDLQISPSVTAASSAYDWSGFYAGVNAGYGGGTFQYPVGLDFIVPEGFPEYYDANTEEVDDFFEGLFPDVNPADLDGGEILPLGAGSLGVTAGGFVGGVQAGYNFMAAENFLLGIEADIQGSSVAAEISATITAPMDGDLLAAGTTLDWYGTLRARAGFAQDRVLGYVTGGLAYGRTTSSISLLESVAFSQELDRVGWTVGAGVEYALTDNISLRTEYSYVDLGTEDIVSGTVYSQDEGSIAGSLGSTVSFHTVKAGLNFHF